MREDATATSSRMSACIDERKTASDPTRILAESATGGFIGHEEDRAALMVEA